MLTNLEVIVVIVPFGSGSKIIKYGKRAGLTRGTIFIGSGTAKKSILDFLELGSSRQEIVVMAGTQEKVHDALVIIKDRLHLEKPGRGVALSIPINQLIDGSFEESKLNNNKKSERKSMYNIIYTIVEMGKSEEVMSAARKAGSTGATVMTGRGSGIHEQSEKLFGMEIEPQKEIVMIIAHVDKVAAITQSISTELEIENPANGIIFTVNVNEIHGLFDDEK